MTYISCCGAGMHSHLGRCFTYNFSADGYTRGEATASTALKLKPFERRKSMRCMETPLKRFICSGVSRFGLVYHRFFFLFFLSFSFTLC